MIKYISNFDRKSIIDIVSFIIFFLLSVYPGYINIYSKTVNYHDFYIIYFLFRACYFGFLERSSYQIM